MLPAIIPKEEWLAVQELRKRHSGKGLRQSEEYPFTNMLGRLDDFDYALMLRTLDFIEVHAEDRLSAVFQSGVRISIR